MIDACFKSWLAALDEFPQLVDPRSRVNGLLLKGSPRFAT